MDEKRIQVYKSYTSVINLADVEAMAPGHDITDLVEPLGNTLVAAFGDSLVGFSYHEKEHVCYCTFKKLGDAEGLARDWSSVVDLLRDELNIT